jgi:hypothetical protein
MNMSVSQFGNKVEFLGQVNALAPRDYFVFFDDFLTLSPDATVDHSNWDMTVVGATATAPSLDVVDSSQEMTGGVIAIVPDATDSDLIQFQSNSEFILIKEGYPFWFEARLMVRDISTETTAIGMGMTDTTFIAGVPAGALYFAFNPAATLTFVAVNGSGTKTITTPITPADGVWYRVAIYFDGNDTITGYVATDSAANAPFVPVGQLDINTTAHYVPLTLGMALTVAVENTDSGDGSDGTLVDYIYYAQKRCLVP